MSRVAGDDAATEPAPQHPIGLFGFVGGIEVEFLRTGVEFLGDRNARVVEQKSVPYVVARRADVPDGARALALHRPLPDDEVAIAQSEVEALAFWKLTARFEGECYPASLGSDGRITLYAPSLPDERWGGDARDGAYAVMDPGGLDVFVSSYPLDHR